jgi:predicted O-methyltransferase YrrM
LQTFAAADDDGPMLDWNSLEWTGETHLVVDGTTFLVDPQGAGRGETGDGLVLFKPHWMVERYAALRDQVDATNIFELGIFAGGSTALLALLFRPLRLVAIEFNPQPVPKLDAFIKERGMSEAVRPYFGVDQADRPRMEEILAREFGAEPLDLVIDDASHLLDETTASFNLLFPRLRPGGLFVIEDWSWQHHLEAKVAAALRSNKETRDTVAPPGPDAALPDNDQLSRLVIELVLTAAYSDGVVAELTGMRQGWVVVRRGDAPLDPNGFDISQCYGSLGGGLLSDRRPARPASERSAS